MPVGDGDDLGRKGGGNGWDEGSGGGEVWIN